MKNTFMLPPQPGSRRTPFTPHPRLYIPAARIQRLARPFHLPLLRRLRRQILLATDACLSSVRFPYDQDTHNAHLVRARIMQGRIVNLLVAYFLTGRQAYRDAALAQGREIGNWEYWSWITWRQKNPDPLAIFDLSYGENSTTLAILYDLLHAELSETDRRHFQHIATRRSFDPFLQHTRQDASHQPAWWFGHRQSNWNTVCAGGAGMLALAMEDDLPQAATVLQRVETSIAPYMLELRKTRGAWPEGLGYWNYGMRYGFMYLLSRENATRRRHPLLRQNATRQTLQFPLDFCPHGVSCSFGDVNHWRPMPFHLAVAERLGLPDLTATLIRQIVAQPPQPTAKGWPDAADLLLLGETLEASPVRPARPARRATPSPTLRHYPGMDWVALADQQPDPRLYLAIRGGSTEVPHGHRDLLSFHCVADGRPLFVNLSPGEYLDTTFSERRYELFETIPASKNTLLINGVGIAAKSTAQTTSYQYPTWVGARIDATECMGRMRDGCAATFCARLFVLFDAHLALIVDRIILPHPGRVEARFYSNARVQYAPTHALLRLKQTLFRATFAASVPATLHPGLSLPTTPVKPAHLLRWCGDRLHTDFTLATLISRGPAPARLTLKSKGAHLSLEIRQGVRHRLLRLSDRLIPVR